MKQMLLLLLAAGTLIACNNKATETSTAKPDSTVNNETVNLPYSLDSNPDWEKGTSGNVAIAMNTLKAFEVNDMNTLRQNLADSVQFYADAVNFKGTRDSLVSFLSSHRNALDKISIRMQDYESVKSKNRGEEWVSLWYTETTTLRGKPADSTMTMDDIKIVNGKVAVIDSKIRHLVKK